MIVANVFKVPDVIEGFDSNCAFSSKSKVSSSYALQADPVDKISAQTSRMYENWCYLNIKREVKPPIQVNFFTHKQHFQNASCNIPNSE